MNKKFICTVCGYVHEGNEAPEKCPLCGAPKSKFKELAEDATLEFVTEHQIGIAKEGTDEEMIKDLNTHFLGECTEVGMYLAMSRQADREGYPEVAEAFKRYAWEEAEHASKFAELLGDVVCFGGPKNHTQHGGGHTSKSVWRPKQAQTPTRCALPAVRKRWASMLSTIPCMKWLKTKHATDRDSMVSSTVSSKNKLAY